MDRLQQMQLLQGRGQGMEGDSTQVDTAEHVYISSLALLKMLKHGEIFWMMRDQTMYSVY